MGGRFCMLVLLMMCVSGSLFLLYYFRYVIRSIDFIRTVPECDSCNRNISVNSVLKIDYCDLEQTSSAVPPDLLIFVLCRFNDAKSREIIRQTWGSVREQLAGNFRVVFVVGQGTSAKLSSEHSSYGDILQVDVQEKYRKLTEKVTRAFLWFNERCHNIKYVFKTDTDVFINVPFIFRIIKNHSLKNTIAGKCFQSFEKPDRRNTSKWYVSEQEYPGSRYPHYCSGSGYLMERATASKLSGVFKDTPMFPMEDVYMGFCAHKTEVDVVTFSGFNIRSLGYDEFLYCHCTGVVHKISSGKQREIWRRHERYCARRWTQWSGYPITCLVMFSHYLVILLVVVTFIIVLIGAVICRRRLKFRKIT